MGRMELLSPAGNAEAVRAAVQNGADAVYFGFGHYNARRNAANISQQEMAQIISYCHVRGVQTHITLNTMLSDRELDKMEEELRVLAEAGADAVIVQDLGVAERIGRCVPGIRLHGSTQMSIHTLDGAKALEQLGFSRVVLARELSLSQIENIAAQTRLETEVFVHGALCMCYSGQCYFSAMLGGRSGNRGLCAQPCRLPFRMNDGEEGYPLSLKDLNLSEHLAQLENAGVDSLKIEGRMKRAEYVAIVTRIYHALLKEKRLPTEEEAETLRLVFSREGFTQGYFTGEKGKDMFGVKTNVPLSQVQQLYHEAQQSYADGREMARVPIEIDFQARAELPVSLTLRDESRSVKAEGPVPQAAEKKSLNEESVAASLGKLGGTPYVADAIRADIAPDLFLPVSALNELRRRALSQLKQMRAQRPISFVEYPREKPEIKDVKFQGLTVKCLHPNQITREMLQHPPQCVYLPLTWWQSEGEQISYLQHRGLTIVPALPRVFSDEEQPALERLLVQAAQQGAQGCLCGNLGHVLLARRCGLKSYGDFGLNVANSHALRRLRDLGLDRQTLSFEVRLPQLRDIRKSLDTELVIYGRQPLMITENCFIRASQGSCECRVRQQELVDHKGVHFPVLPEFGCRNTIYNSKTLKLEGQRDEWEKTGVAFARLDFTVETPDECEQVYRAYSQGRDVHVPGGVTRGLYYRGVE